MEIVTVPNDSNSKENLTLYQEWFNYADAGYSINKISLFSLLLCKLKFLGYCFSPCLLWLWSFWYLTFTLIFSIKGYNYATCLWKTAHVDVAMNKAFNVFIFPFMWFLMQYFIFFFCIILLFCENNVVIGNLCFLYRWRWSLYRDWSHQIFCNVEFVSTRAQAGFNFFYLACALEQGVCINRNNVCVH